MKIIRMLDFDKIKAKPKKSKDDGNQLKNVDFNVSLQTYAVSAASGFPVVLVNKMV